MENNQLKDIRCRHKGCGAVLCRTDGARLIAPAPVIPSAKLSRKKKNLNPLYCEKCHRITGLYKIKQNFARFGKTD